MVFAKKVMLCTSVIYLAVVMLMGTLVNIYMEYNINNRETPPETATSEISDAPDIDYSDYASGEEESEAPVQYETTDVYALIIDEAIMGAVNLGVELKQQGTYLIISDGEIEFRAQLQILDNKVFIQSSTMDNNLVRILVRAVSVVYEMPECFTTFNSIHDVPFTNGQLTVGKDASGFKVEIDPLYVLEEESE